MSPNRFTFVHILRAFHGWLGRWITEADQPAAAVTSRGTRDRDKPRARRKAKGADRSTQHTADSPRTSERKSVCWFDCDPDALRAAMPSDPDREEREEFERWEAQHFRSWPGRR
jgi:hypothetical protein